MHQRQEQYTGVKQPGVQQCDLVWAGRDLRVCHFTHESQRVRGAALTHACCVQQRPVKRWGRRVHTA